MLPAQNRVPTTSERLPWAEICRRYPDQHVYLVNVEREVTYGPAIRTAQVIGAGTTNRQALDQAMQWRGHHEDFVHRFTGHYKLELRRPPLLPDDELRDLLRT